MFNYAELNEQFYCVGISQLTNKIEKENMILVDEDLEAFLGRKYDLENKCWTNEYFKFDKSGIDNDIYRLEINEKFEYIITLLELNGGTYV